MAALEKSMRASYQELCTLVDAEYVPVPDTQVFTSAADTPAADIASQVDVVQVGVADSNNVRITCFIQTYSCPTKLFWSLDTQE